MKYSTIVLAFAASVVALPTAKPAKRTAEPVRRQFGYSTETLSYFYDTFMLL